MADEPTDHGPIVVPSAEVLALVRHAEPPADPPDELLPFVISVVDETGTLDWYLTEDALAFGDVALPSLFSHWRTGWERSWTLDPASSLNRLRSAAKELDASWSEFERLLVGVTMFDRMLVLEPSVQGVVAAELEHARDLVIERGREGFGYVDASEGKQPNGLARTWSGQDGPEVLAADHRVEASMDPERGLIVRMLDGSAELNDTMEVRIEADEVVARSESEELHLDFDDGRVLTWLVPGATVFRVRRIPESVVWARTFAGMEECCRYATALGQPVRLTTGRFFSTGDRA